MLEANCGVNWKPCYRAPCKVSQNLNASAPDEQCSKKPFFLGGGLKEEGLLGSINTSGPDPVEEDAICCPRVRDPE